MAPKLRNQTPTGKAKKLTASTSSTDDKSQKKPKQDDDSRRILMLFYACGGGSLLSIIFFFNYLLPSLDTVLESDACILLQTKGLLTWGLEGKLPGTGDATQKDSTDFYTTVIACGDAYQEKHGAWLIAGFCVLYFTMQSFVIPGTGILSLLSGALFPIWQAELFVALCASGGATVSYFFSKLMGSVFIEYFQLEEKLKWFREQVHQLSGMSLLFFMTTLRSTPVPNLLINVGSPHAGVDPLTFFLSTLVGLVPLNTCHILSGKALVTMGKVEKGPGTAIFLVGSIICVILWVMVKKQEAKGSIKKKNETKKTETETVTDASTASSTSAPVSSSSAKSDSKPRKRGKTPMKKK